jgi:protein tyrosine/serine phosphatase
MAKKRRLWIILFVLGLVMIGGSLGWAILGEPFFNFGVVEEAVLYRSAQPGRWQLQRAFERIPFRTIVNLRGEDERDAWYRNERDFASENHITLINLKMRSHDVPKEDGLAQFFRIMQDPSSHPVLVHCRWGSDRTGLIVAAYRMKFNGYDWKKAAREMRLYRFLFLLDDYQKKFLIEFEASLPRAN